MGFLTASKRRRSVKARQPNPTEMMVGFRRHFPHSTIPFDDRPLNERFQSWDYICSQRNATAIKTLPLRAYTNESSSTTKHTKAVHPSRRKALKNAAPQFTTDDTIEVVDHEFLLVMRRPNPVIIDQAALLSLTANYLQMKGTAYWYVRYNQLGQPMQLWPLPSQLVWPVFSGKGEEVVERFEMRYAGQITEFDPDEIVWFRIPSIIDPMTVWSDSDGIRSASETNKRMIEYEHGLMENFAVPDNLIVPKEDITPEQANEEVTRWEQMFGGWRKRGKTAFSTYSIDKVLNLGMTNRELQFKESKPQVREEIAAGRGVPLPVITVDGSTFSNMKTGLQIWAMFTVDPLAAMIASTINSTLMRRYGTRTGGMTDAVDQPSVFVAFDSAVPDDEKEITEQNVSNVTTGILTPNEARGNIGRDDRPDGLGDDTHPAAAPQPESSIIDVPDLFGDDVIDVPTATEAEQSGTEERVDGTDIAKEPVTFNELSLGMERAFRVNDLETVNMLRAEMAEFLGNPAPADLTELGESRATTGFGQGGTTRQDEDDEGDDDKPKPKAGAEAEQKGATDAPASTVESSDHGRLADRDDDKESSAECVARRVKELSAEHPEWERDQVVAVAIDKCEADGKCWAPRTGLEAAVCGLHPLTAEKLALGEIREKLRDRDFITDIRELFDAMQEDVESKLAGMVFPDKSATKSTASEIVGMVFDTEQWAAMFLGLGMDHLGRAVMKGTEIGAADLASMAGFTMDTVDVGVEALRQVGAVSSDVVLRATEKLAKRFASVVVAITQDELRQVLTDEFSAGTTSRKVSQAIAALFDEKRSKATDRIARTEMSNALNGGAQLAWKENGVDENKWLASVDACQFCLALHDQIRQVGKAFVPKGRTVQGVDGGRLKADYKTVVGPTLHPHCRCTLVPVVAQSNER